ncbi:MAG: helix-turn-helix domain-containing protein [Limisphaerales bacterium]
MKKKPMTFAEQLKAVRRREGYSQAMAARLIPKLSKRTLEAWERNQQAPPLWAQALVLESLGGAPYDPAKRQSATSRRRRA